MSVAVVILILGLLWLMVVSPGFRYLILGIVGILVLWAWSSIQEAGKQAQYREAIAAAKPLPTAADVVLSDVTLMHDRPQAWTIEGTIDNKMRDPLNDIEFDVLVKDGTRIIDEKVVRLCRGGTPAGQARTFKTCEFWFGTWPATESEPVVWAQVTAVNGRGLRWTPFELLRVEQKEQRARRSKTS
jgi:hypothetical protein